MHRRGVPHRDISPANIVLSAGGTPSVVDFALATSLAELRPAFTHHTEIVGTLAYLAPEATGRTGRPVDQRADHPARLNAPVYLVVDGHPRTGPRHRDRGGPANYRSEKMLYELDDDGPRSSRARPPQLRAGPAPPGVVRAPLRHG